MWRGKPCTLGFVTVSAWCDRYRSRCCLAHLYACMIDLVTNADTSPDESLSWCHSRIVPPLMLLTSPYDIHARIKGKFLEAFQRAVIR
jgi:hypothetical protein